MSLIPKEIIKILILIFICTTVILILFLMIFYFTPKNYYISNNDINFKIINKKKIKIEPNSSIEFNYKDYKNKFLKFNLTNKEKNKINFFI